MCVPDFLQGVFWTVGIEAALVFVRLLVVRFYALNPQFLR
jgi:hypothetical protein